MLFSSCNKRWINSRRSIDEFTIIENDLHTYTSTYRNGTSYVDEYSGDATETPVIKANAYPYNYVTCS